MQKWNTLASLAMLGTQRAALPKESLWPVEESTLAPAATTTALASSAPREAGPEVALAEHGARNKEGTFAAAAHASTARSLAASVPSEARSARSALQDCSAEHTVLRAAAANCLWELAGTRAVPAPLPQIEPAPPADAPFVSEPAAWRLARMFNGEHRELVGEWFALAAERGVRVAPQWLPVVLDALESAARNEFSAVLGPHALWLAKQNSAWALHPASSQPSEERWTNGTQDERRAELTALRAIDPARARAWIESTWKVDPPNAREEFIRALLVNLSHEDEPLLESALDDKRKSVRSAAAECLVRLPESAHANRNYARLHALIELEPKPSGFLGKLRKRRLEVQLPASLEKPDIRDGLDLNAPAGRKIGERAYWLEQMVAIARPAHWTQRFDCDVQTFIDAALATEYARNLLLALSQAAIRHADVAWISMLSTTWLEWKEAAEHSAEQFGMVTALVAAVPLAERPRLLDQLLDVLDASRFGFAHALLANAGFNWDAAMTRRALTLLSKQITAETQQWSHPKNTLLPWGRQADVATASSILSDLIVRTADKSPWRNALEAMQEIIDFRAAMKQELMT